MQLGHTWRPDSHLCTTNRRCPYCGSRQACARSGISGMQRIEHLRKVFHAADQRSRSFSGDDRPQHETEHHSGTGSDRDTGQENPDSDTENCGGHGPQRDIGRRRPRTGDRTSPFATVDNGLAQIITRRLTRKSDPRCSMGQEPTTRRSGCAGATQTRADRALFGRMQPSSVSRSEPPDHVVRIAAYPT